MRVPRWKARSHVCDVSAIPSTRVCARFSSLFLLPPLLFKLTYSLSSPFKLIYSILVARYAHTALLFASCKLSVLINENGGRLMAADEPSQLSTCRDFVEGFRVTGERRHLPRRWYLEVSNYGRYTSFYLRDALNGSTHPPTSPPSLSRSSTPSMDDSKCF